jgi:hypothetical protein
VVSGCNTKETTNFVEHNFKDATNMGEQCVGARTIVNWSEEKQRCCAVQTPNPAQSEHHSVREKTIPKNFT